MGERRAGAGSGALVRPSRLVGAPRLVPCHRWPGRALASEGKTLGGLAAHHHRTSHQLEPARAAAIGRLGGRYLAAFERTVDPVALRYRVAAVVLSLATGPYRVQQPGWQVSTRYRVELAQRWLESARALARRRLRLPRLVG